MGKNNLLNSIKTNFLSKLRAKKYCSLYWLGIIFVVTIVAIAWHDPVLARDNNVVPTNAELQGTLDAIWVLVAAILVIFMNAGFSMLETGFCRHKNAVNILAKNAIVFVLATLAYWAVGYSLMFGEGDIFSLDKGWFLSSEVPQTYGLEAFPTGLPISVHFLFHAAFAGTAATIVSGAVAERIKFIDFLIYSFLLCAISYPITGNWVWGNNGWLQNLGFIDFAGSTAVHSVGGLSGLIGSILLGPRIGKYQDKQINAIPGHNMSIATLGCLILWIGWFGFNPGSELAATPHVAYIAVVTNLAAAAGGVAATLTSWLRYGLPDLSMVINGILAGLVAITAACNNVSFISALIIGSAAGIIVVFAVSWLEGLRLDDPVGAVSVHLINGIWGTIAAGIFDIDRGLATGHGFEQIGIQLLGIGAIGAFTGLFSFIVWSILKYTLGLRVDRSEEIQGLDLGEHNMEAYSGFLMDTYFSDRSNPIAQAARSEQTEITNRPQIQSHEDWQVYKMSFAAAMQIFLRSKQFPVEERDSLTKEIINSSRLVCSNLARAWQKRSDRTKFIAKLNDALTEVKETQTWLKFAVKCKYLDLEVGREIYSIYHRISGILERAIADPSPWIVKR